MVVACPHCAAPVGDGRFCTNCGAPLDDRAAARETATDPETDGVPEPDPAGDRSPWSDAPTSAGRPPPPPDDTPPPARLVACHRCGADNAASRDRCARCRADLAADTPIGTTALRDDPAQAPPPPGQARAAGGTEAGREPPLPGVLLLGTIIAAVAVLAVVLTLLSARGVGPFGGPSDRATDVAEADGVDVVGITATSELPGAVGTTYTAENLLDDDPATAWNEGEPGDGTGQRLELELAGPTDVSGLLVWNGYQSGDRYAQHNRVRTLRLEIGDRAFRVRLLDRRGPQAIELPEPVTGERVTLEILATFPGDRYNDAALSEVDVLGVPAGPQPSTNV